MTLLHVDNPAKSADSASEPRAASEREVLSEGTFKRKFAIERKRSERSQEPFLLMLLDAGDNHSSEKNGRALDSMLAALLTSSRETDVVGWHKERAVIGVMFTGLVVMDKNAVLGTILRRVSTLLQAELTFDQFSQVSISFHFFPDDWDQEKPGRPSNSTLYPDLANSDKSKRSLLTIKRAMDVVGSALMLLLCAPVMLLIALAVKVSSKGPILFRQQRVGQHGQCFTFLKFRSMQTNNDQSVHKEYVRKLIANQALCEHSDRQPEGIYKLTNDKRITRVGKFLRRTSLDELPQFFNVLIGDMSLVGPRPPIPYELETYQTWHRRRLLEVKPGITGLWQVTGRTPG